MELVERSEQLRILRGVFDSARRGAGCTVLVSGEAGIGKTSLLRAFVRDLDRPVRVLWGACDDLSTPRMLGPFRDMAGQPNNQLGDPGLDRDRLIDALMAYLRRPASPAVVVVEDVHWADDASLDVIRYLARRVDGLPAVLALSYRDEELSPIHPLRRILGSLAHSGLRRIPLHGLSAEAVGRLAAEAGLDPARVVSLVGGNPFYLAEVIDSAGSWVPASVEDAVLTRVGRLPLAVRELLQVLSVIPGGPWPDLVKLLAGRAAQQLEDARRAGVLDGSGAQVRFRHELARRVVEASLSPARRIDCNRRVLAGLLAVGADASLIVHHAAAAGDDATVTAYAPSAARAALAAKSYREAATLAALALARRDNGDPAATARLHGCAAKALFAINRLAEAAGQADRAVAIWDRMGARPVELADALLISAGLSTSVGQPEAAAAKAERALGILETLGPGPELALCYSTLGAQHCLRGEFASSIAWCDRAIEVAGPLNLPDIRARGLGYRGLARVSVSDDGGFDDMREAVALAREVDHGDYLTVVAHNLGVALIRTERHVEAKAYLDIAERAAREHGLTRAAYFIEGKQCQILLLKGDWEPAERRLRALLATEDDPGANAAPPLSFLGRILARRGEPQADEVIERAWSLASATGEQQKMASAGGARIEGAWLRGDDEAVRRLGRELVELAIGIGHPYLRAEALRYLRRVGGDVAAFPGCPPAFAAGLAGDWSQAAQLWSQAVNPYEMALELVESPQPATAFEGLRTLDRLGASVAAARARCWLRERGIDGIPRGPRPSTRANPGALTDRQLDVLGRAAEGLTNAEIAARLVVSKRTVDNHMAAILVRLGVASRQQAIRALRGLGDGRT
ncbi:LuxR family transcriptional regulator [Rugosimonospora africana]|uniref:LuxR family transcriptional regulator n=1 Tax=Rugosimonospora africana TaxID=556532 RepID=A0A8J3QSG3_9ACTN|nr:LuxR family transcriptional regulator [Rugosimonospora africana]